MSRKDWNGIATVFILSILISFILFPHCWLHLNDFFFHFEGDALKNYYTYLYYAKWGEGLQFKGMNYPRGEHVLFTDAIIPISLFVKCINQTFHKEILPPLGTLNLLLLLSPIFGSIGYFLLLKRFKIQTFLSILAAISIMLFSPQNSRLWGHYSLAFIVIPFFLLWLENYFHSNKKRYFFLLLVLLFTMLFTHMYHFMMMLMYLIVYIAIKPFVTKDFKPLKTIGLFFSSFLLLVGFMMWLKVTDGIIDRPTKPWGFFFARADWYTVFLPTYNRWLNNLMHFDYTTISIFEGRVYIGAATSVLIILSLLFLSKKRLSQESNLLVISSIPLLLFSMGLPFTLGWEDGLDIIPFIRQFRAPGRFAWFFFYTIFIWIILQYSRSNAIKNPILRHAILIFYFLLLFIDITEQVRSVNGLGKNGLGKEFLQEDYKEILLKKNYDVNDFQAIIPFPYFHLGSELLQVEHLQNLYEASKCSYETGLGMTNSALSRTSYSEATESLQLISNPFTYKRFLKKCHPSKPFLIVSSTKNLSEYELYYLSKSKIIDTINGAIISAIYPQDFEPNFYQIDSIASLGYKPIYFAQNIDFKARPNHSITSGFVHLPIKDTGEFCLSIGVFHEAKHGDLPFVQIQKEVNDVQTYNDWAYFSRSNDIGVKTAYLNINFSKSVKDEVISISLNRFFGKVKSIMLRKQPDAIYTTLSGEVMINNIPIEDIK